MVDFMENPAKMDDLGVPPSQETSTCEASKTLVLIYVANKRNLASSVFFSSTVIYPLVI